MHVGVAASQSRGLVQQPGRGGQRLPRRTYHGVHHQVRGGPGVGLLASKNASSPGREKGETEDDAKLASSQASVGQRAFLVFFQWTEWPRFWSERYAGLRLLAGSSPRWLLNAKMMVDRGAVVDYWGRLEIEDTEPWVVEAITSGGCSMKCQLLTMGCLVCGKYTAGLCGGCRETRFCSEECMEVEWPTHRLNCTGGLRFSRAGTGTRTSITALYFPTQRQVREQEFGSVPEDYKGDQQYAVAFLPSTNGIQGRRVPGQPAHHNWVAVSSEGSILVGLSDACLGLTMLLEAAGLHFHRMATWEVGVMMVENFACPWSEEDGWFGLPPGPVVSGHNLLAYAYEVIAWAAGNLMVEREPGHPMWPGMAAVSCRLPQELVESYAARSKAVAAVVSGGPLDSWADFPRKYGGQHPVYRDGAYEEDLRGPYVTRAPGEEARRSLDINLTYCRRDPALTRERVPLECGGERGGTDRPLDGLATDGRAAQERMGSQTSLTMGAVDRSEVGVATRPVCRGFLGRGCALHRFGFNKDTGVPEITELAMQCAVCRKTSPSEGGVDRVIRLGAKPSGGEPIYVGTIKYKPGACDRPLLMPREQLVAAVRAAVLKAQPRLVSGMTGLSHLSSAISAQPAQLSHLSSASSAQSSQLNKLSSAR